MGNAISGSYDVSYNLYEKYYPKSHFLRPAYVSSAGMVLALGSQLMSERPYEANTFNNFIFLFSSGASLGMQLWVSFISGLTMIRLLPRHEFGVVQSYLFPKFFFLASLFGFGSLCSFLRMNPISAWKDDTLVLGTLLASNFSFNIINFVWFNIKTIDYNQKMHKIEKNAGVGLTTIGRLKEESKIDNDPEYSKYKNKFVLYHSLSLVSNLISVASTCAEFYFLADRSFFSF